MNKEDQDIKDFFKNVKQADHELDIPVFKLPIRNSKRSVLRYLIPMGVAASLLWFGWYFVFNNKNDNSETLEFVVEFSEGNDTSSLLVKEESINDWHASSDFLIDDFDK